MRFARILLGSVLLPTCVLGCSATPTDDAPGDNGTGGTAIGGAGGTGVGGSGSSPTGGAGGTTSTGGAGGTIAAGGSAGTIATGGSAGTIATGGSAGTIATGGSAGTTATGGSAGTLSTGGTGGPGGGSGGKANGGSGGKAGGGSGGKASGGAAGSGTGGSSVDCSAPTPTGGTTRTSSNASGTAAGLTWTVWSNAAAGSITYFNTPAFNAAWNNSGDFLARLGLQWNATRTYDQYGVITAHYASRKTGTGGGYSYIGIYGWSVSPCVEYYIVDDSYNRMPVNPGSTTNKGTATIDGGTYTLYTRNTSGTGGSKCPGVSNWVQFYSVRQTARTCGQISITEHFNAWAAAGMTLGRMDQAQIFVEVGGGSGSIEFPVANVTTTMN